MKTLLSCAGVLALTLPLAYGQALPPKFRAEIPFVFYVGDTAMPAGSYDLDVLRFATGTGVVVRTNGQVPLVAARIGSISGQPNPKSEAATLVFYKYDNDHSFLRQMVHGGSQAVLNLPMSRLEREHVSSTFQPVAGKSGVKVVVLASVR